MSKLIALQTVKAGKTMYAPGDEFDVSDADTIKALIDAGAAKQKTRAVADDSDDPVKAPAKK